MNRLALALGGVMVLGVLGVGAIDAKYAARNWSTMGPVSPGTALESFAVHRLNGAGFDQDDFRGRVTVVTFWATWCHACQGELVDLDELDDRYVDRAGVQFLAVNWEGSGYTLPQRQRVASAYARQTSLALPIAVDDGSMARALRVGAIPHTLLVDGEGTIRHVYPGRVRASTVADDIDDLLGEL